MLTVDGRCFCPRCEGRTKNIYRMVGSCWNCKTQDILVLFRAGDPSHEQDCPVCGNYHSVHVTRLATLDEYPEAAAVSATTEGEP